MNAFNLIKWSERRQVLAVIVLAGLILFALWFFLLTPLNHRRRGLERDIETMRAQLASKNYLVGEDALAAALRQAERHNADLRREWATTASRLVAFTNRTALSEGPVGHIDFKVALFDVRHRLLQKSRKLRISLPSHLGMEDTVSSDEDARKLMLQLRTVEKLVDLALDLQIQRIGDIKPLRPIQHKTGDAGEVFLEEFPIAIEFYGPLDTLCDLFRAILVPDHTFVLKHLKVEPVLSGPENVLKVNAVMSALTFLKRPREIARPKPAPRVKRRGPLGY